MDATRERSTKSQHVLAVIGAAAGVLAIVLLTFGRESMPGYHTMLDTGAFLLSGMLAALFWDMGARLDRPIKRWLALAFAATALLELMHALSALEWTGAFAWITRNADALRPATWSPAAHVLPLGIGGAILGHHRQARGVWAFAAALLALCVGMVGAYVVLPAYTTPSWLGVSRPLLMAVPVLWVVVGLACWRLRASDRILPTMAWMALVIFVGQIAMLYSQTPHDTPSIIAHLAKTTGYLMVMIALMQFASQDMVRRIAAEQALARSNQLLEQRVAERTSELQIEVDNRRHAERRLQDQLQRMNLLQHITRAIGERQDIRSIFQVVVRSVEEHLPVDLACIGLHGVGNTWIDIACVGVRSEALAMTLAMTEQARVDIDENGLSRCMRGQLVYEPDIGQVAMPFPQRLAAGDLRALVLAPLLIESQVFGVLIVARRAPESFASGDCEFLRQLSEHVALASHQAQLNGALQRAYDDLRQTQAAIMQQERLKALGQMASGIAHDINNAISPAAIYAESLLEREPGLSDRARGHLQTIQRAIEDVAKTVARMREFYRDREAAIALVPVRLNELAQHVLDLTHARWHDMPQEHGHVIEVKTAFDPQLPAVLGAENEIREALTNLIFNAVDAMPRGGTLTLRTRALGDAAVRHAPRHALIEVIDTGIGMDEATRLRCMEPFFTTKGERGTGLGLAMVYGVAQRHGATLEIDSTPGQGSTMRLIFTVPEAVIGASEIGRAPPRLRRQRVLVIDDDPLLLKSLRDVLEGDGHQVTAMNGGQIGIETFLAARNAQGFDLVITDLGMPHVDGRQVIAAIKRASPETPVILLTGWGERLLDSGDAPANVDRVLSKPPKLRELREAMAHCLRDAREAD